MAALLGACTGGGGALPGEDGGVGASSSGASGSGASSSGGSSGTSSSSGSSGASGSSGTSSSSGSSGGDASFDATPQDSGCVGTTYQLAFVPPGGGSECGFTMTQPYTPGQINLVLTPGWGTVCHATSSQGCGSGASADGWWINGNEILLCDATCSRFYDQPNGKLTVRLGCPTMECTH